MDTAHKLPGPWAIRSDATSDCSLHSAGFRLAVLTPPVCHGPRFLQGRIGSKIGARIGTGQGEGGFVLEFAGVHGAGRLTYAQSVPGLGACPGGCRPGKRAFLPGRPLPILPRVVHLRRCPRFLWFQSGALPHLSLAPTRPNLCRFGCNLPLRRQVVGFAPFSFGLAFLAVCHDRCGAVWWGCEVRARSIQAAVATMMAVAARCAVVRTIDRGRYLYFSGIRAFNLNINSPSE